MFTLLPGSGHARTDLDSDNLQMSKNSGTNLYQKALLSKQEASFIGTVTNRIKSIEIKGRTSGVATIP